VGRSVPDVSGLCRRRLRPHARQARRRAPPRHAPRARSRRGRSRATVL